MRTPQIIPACPRLCADVAREAKATNSRCVVMHNRVVIQPRKLQPSAT